MNSRSLLFCEYCAVVILVPANPHPYTFFIDTIVWLINIFCYHFFRAFLTAGTLASKTIFHSLFWSLTVSFQLYSSVLTFYGVLGNLFKASTEEFVNSQPGAACVLTMVNAYNPGIPFLSGNLETHHSLETTLGHGTTSGEVSSAA